MLAIAAGALLGGVIGATVASLVTALMFSGLKLAVIGRVQAPGFTLLRERGP